MTDPDDFDALAGEYALGALDPEERARVAGLRPREPRLDRAIALWEDRLAPLDDATPGIAPPAGLFETIESRIRTGSAARVASTADAGAIFAARRELRRWRLSTFGVGAIAAVLAFLLLAPMTWRDASSPSFIGVLQHDPAAAAFIVQADPRRRTLSVLRLAPAPPANKSYELWIIRDARSAPQSLGVIGRDGTGAHPLAASDDPDKIEAATYAVTVEPAGGSPTGAPTSPPLWTGKLVPTRI